VLKLLENMELGKFPS